MKVNKFLLAASVAVVGFGVDAMMGDHVEAASWEARTVEQVQADLIEAGNEKTYTIQWGDTLGVIARAIKADVNALAELNDIENKNLIMPGEKLIITTDASGEAKSVKAENDPAPAKKAAPKAQAQAPAQQPAAQAAPKQQAPVQQAPANNNYQGQSSNAKEIIAQRESGGSYNARNGQYIGRYQLSASYLGGDYSPANQERVADQYVANRYGSWDNALAFWNANGWY